MEEARWYVVHTYSGYENKVKANIEKAIENRHLENQILEVRVPIQEVRELRTRQTKEGEEKIWKDVQKKMFPGYVLLHMIMNNDTWFVVRNTRGVTGFVGPGSQPLPLSETEMFNLGIQASNMEVNVETEFKVGDTIKVISGAWRDNISRAVAVNPSKMTLTIMVETLGTETPVTLSFSDVIKI